MYHGGTNPEGKLHTLNECQTSPGTANNDLPVCTYDFQAPLGEYGQTYPHYFLLRKLHLFLHDWGEVLAPMEAYFPSPQDLEKGADNQLRWSYRKDGDHAFVFINNYERLQPISDKKNVELEAVGVRFPKLTIPSGTICVFPVNIDGIRYATAQLVAKRDGKIYMEQIKGIPTTICMADGKVLKNVKVGGLEKPVYKNIYLVDSRTAEHLFLAPSDEGTKLADINFRKIKDCGSPRTISIGKAKVAEAPTDADFNSASVYEISLPENRDALMAINYRGDMARLYADGKLIADNFYYGRPFFFGLWRLPKDCSKLELKVLPLQTDMPVYFPREAATEPGEQVKSIELFAR
jgi:hypothetical protein